jgi:hypothetical protein
MATELRFFRGAALVWGAALALALILLRNC